MSMAVNRRIPRRKNRAAVELHAYLTAQFNKMDKDLSGLVRIEDLQELAFHSSAVPRFFGYSPPVPGVPRLVDVVRGASGEQREQGASAALKPWSGVQMSSSSRESPAIRDWNEGEGASQCYFAPDLLAEDARWAASLERWKEKLDPDKRGYFSLDEWLAAAYEHVEMKVSLSKLLAACRRQMRRTILVLCAAL